jgi:hypothetical protein
MAKCGLEFPDLISVDRFLQMYLPDIQNLKIVLVFSLYFA